MFKEKEMATEKDVKKDVTVEPNDAEAGTSTNETEEAPELIEKVEAETVNIAQGGAQVVTAEKVFVEQGGIARAEGTFIDVKEGGIAIAQGENVTLTDGGVGIIAAENVKLHDAMAVFVAANEIEGDDVTILFDIRAAIVFGLVLGFVSSLFKLITRRKG
jgi:hypothetical protein